MRALSVRQPFAEFLASGEKTEEYRTWAPRSIVGQDLLIVSSKTPEEGGEDLPLGVAVCIVHVDAIRDDGEIYAWEVSNPRRVGPEPIKGSAALFHVDDTRIRIMPSEPRPRPVAPKSEPRRARPKAPPPPVHPYELEAEGLIVASAATPKEARAIAKREANTRRVYVRILRDGHEVSGEEPDDAPAPFIDAEPGERYTFSIAGKRVPGSEPTEVDARDTATFLTKFHHGATVTILFDGMPFDEVG